MNEELRKVIKGYSKLSSADRKEFIKQINEAGMETGKLNEQVQKSDQITMGPLGNGCPCCGR